MRYTFLISLLAVMACNEAKVESVSSVTDTSFSLEGKKVYIYSTVDSTDLRLSLTDSVIFQEMGQPPETQPSVFVDPSHKFQTMLGIGAALTDASAETFYKLPVEKQEEFLRAYFDTVSGIGYTLARTNMNSCDFSSDMYTYVKEGDKELASFNVAHDEKYKIPFIKKAMERAGKNLKLYISPWSPPAWMKDNNNMKFGGKLKPEYYSSWASYYLKYMDALEKNEVPVWGLTVQNEPMARQIWESCMYTAEEERNFIRDHLGPALVKSSHAGKKLIAWDHNRDLIYQRAAAILNDPATSKYVWGIGFHWYESWTGDHMFENVERVQNSFPNTNLLFTEGCNGPFTWNSFDHWQWGENYGLNMIHDFNNGAVGWTDWNILLDEVGGPNHVKNYCFAPVHAKTGEGSLHYMNSYYYIGHFSKFIRPGARRVISSSSRAQLLTTAFQNPDGSISVVVMNPTNEKFDYRMYLGNKAVSHTSRPHSIYTLVIK